MSHDANQNRIARGRFFGDCASTWMRGRFNEIGRVLQIAITRDFRLTIELLAFIVDQRLFGRLINFEYHQSFLKFL